MKKRMSKLFVGITVMLFMSFGLYLSNSKNINGVTLAKTIALAFPSDSELAEDNWVIEEIREHYIRCASGGSFACEL